MIPAREIVGRLGGHPAARLGLDLEDDGDAFRWLAAACLLSGRVSEERALEAWHALDAEGGTALAALAGASPQRVAATLEKARIPRPERPALLLVRLARALRERHGGSLHRLLSGADDLPAAGAALVGLAPGLGPATALRFLRPLRETLAVAREVPLAPAALAAARDLGLAGESDEGAPDALLAAAASDGPPAPRTAVADLEAALERLGRLSCAAGRPERCPLGDLCPRRP